MVLQDSGSNSHTGYGLSKPESLNREYVVPLENEAQNAFCLELGYGGILESLLGGPGYV